MKDKIKEVREEMSAIAVDMYKFRLQAELEPFDAATLDTLRDRMEVCVKKLTQLESE